VVALECADEVGVVPETAVVAHLLDGPSADKGRTWSGPTRPIDIDYNLHGFIPLVDGKRIYNFGTQAIWGMYTNEDGLHENAPIGYRYSDDDGYHWSEVRIIRPTNDPGFTGMSVMRMCETVKGTWLLGTHEGDWTYKPLMTRQYVLRSEDKGKTWELLPGKRHGGWHVREYNRMDEGRPIQLADGRVLLMIRTPEGHLWLTWSEDDGRTWTEPRFVFSTAMAPLFANVFFNYQCSYMDMFLEGSTLNLFIPHMWHRVLHLAIDESDLMKLSVDDELQR